MSRRTSATARCGAAPWALTSAGRRRLVSSAKMEDLLRTEMQAGALGLSTRPRVRPRNLFRSERSHCPREGRGAGRWTLHQPHPQRGPPVLEGDRRSDRNRPPGEDPRAGLALKLAMRSLWGQTDRLIKTAGCGTGRRCEHHSRHLSLHLLAVGNDGALSEP